MWSAHVVDLQVMLGLKHFEALTGIREDTAVHGMETWIGAKAVPVAINMLI